MRAKDAASPAFLVALPLVFLLFHLPYLPKSLEDLDSINFALGVRHFDVAEHQPHPPGYPLYILAAKGVRLAAGSELAALGLLSVLAGALGVLSIAALARRVDREAGAWPIAATLLAVTSPLYWFTSSRPLSDVPGLAAAIAIQAMTIAASTSRTLYAAGFCAGLAAGLRSQVAWLTVPLLLVTGLRLGGWAVAARARSRAPSVVPACAALAAFTLGVLLWAVPLVALTGGPRTYWRALAFQGSADVNDIQMLWTRHGARDVADALYYAFVAPWAAWPLAAAVLALAMIGLVSMALRYRPALALLAAAFGPYFVFDLLFQETFTSRYALPLVVPLAYLAAAGARVLPWRTGMVAVAAVATVSAHIGGTSVAAFAGQPTPAFRLLDAMRGSMDQTGQPPVLAMDRRQSFDFRRPIAWADGALPKFTAVLPAPPQHEWLEPVKFWTGGGRAPVWFVVDPKRSMIDLVQHEKPDAFRWALPYPVLVGGSRPDEMDLYRVAAPEWFLGEGWALTPEAAGIADVDRRGLAHAEIHGWISGKVAGGVLAVGGRNFESAVAPRVSVQIGGRPVREFVVSPGGFLEFVPLPEVAAGDPAAYEEVTIGASPLARVAIEQFDVSAVRPIFGYGAGWQEPEFNPRTGLRWRWLSEHGELRLGRPAARLVLHVEGESPRTYFPRGSRLTVRSGDRVVYDDTLSADFSLNIPIPDRTDAVTLDTDQVFQPAERTRGSADRRHLGLRIYRVELRQVP